MEEGDEVSQTKPTVYFNGLAILTAGLRELDEQTRDKFLKKLKIGSPALAFIVEENFFITAPWLHTSALYRRNSPAPDVCLDCNNNCL